MIEPDEREVRDLLAAARAELRAMGAMLDEEVVADAFFGFHAQQVTEKLLKAWLAVLGCAYPVTHNLARLEAALNEMGQDTSAYAELCELTPYAVEARYSTGSWGPEQLDRAETIKALGLLEADVTQLLARRLGPGGACDHHRAS